jgi:hypothetical protein
MAAKRKPSAITEEGERFVEAKMAGLNDRQAKLVSGVGSTDTEAIRHQLTVARSWLRNTTQITRLNVIEGVVDGIEIARMQGDAGNVIKGWTEVGKILGHYAPEIKKIELSMEQGRLKSKFEALTDEELLAIAQGSVIDGECEEISQ